MHENSLKFIRNVKEAVVKLIFVLWKHIPARVLVGLAQKGL